MKIKNLIQDNNRGVLCCVIVLVIIGLFNIYSASYPKALDDNESSLMHYFVRQGVWAMVGSVAMWGMWKFDYRWFRNRGWMIAIAAATIVLLLLTAAFGVKINGSTRWIDLFIIRFQPSEMAKVTAIFLAAGFVGTRLREGKRCTLFSWQLLAVFIISGLVCMQPDLGTAAIIIAIAVVIYCVSDLPPKMYWSLLTIVIGGLCLLAGKADYRSDRIQAWFDPWQYAKKAGYQAVQSEMAIGSGGWTGMGWGQGTSKYFYLPEPHTDFAFAMFCQEWGFIWTLIGVILPFAAFTFYGICIAKQSEDYYGKMLAFGITVLISGQALSNMLMVLGVFPVIGVPLPFISYGGTSLVSNMACVGMLLSIGEQNKRYRLRMMRNAERPPEKPAEKPPVRLKLVSPLRDGRIDKIKNGK